MRFDMMDTEHPPASRKQQISRLTRLVGIGCALGVVALFSSFTLVSRLGLSTTLSLADMAALRFGIAGTLLLPVLLRGGLSGITWREAAAIAFLGGLGFALFAYAGFFLAPAAHGAVLLHGTLPLFTFLIITFSSGQTGTRQTAFGIGLIALGIAIMASDSVMGATPRQLLGDLFLLAAALSWAGYGVVIRRLGLNPIRAAAIVTVLSMACFLPVYAAMPDKGIFLISWQELVFQGFFQGVLIGIISIMIYTRAVAILGASETALFTAAVPCVTTLAAIPLLSEWPSTAAVTGVAIVTLGMLAAIPRNSAPTVSRRQ